MFSPGAAWNYSIGHDVLGRVVEVAAGRPLDRFFAERIFEPLGMADTGFQAKQADLDRLATLYVLDAETDKVSPDEETGQWGVNKPGFFSGGAGLGNADLASFGIPVFADAPPSTGRVTGSVSA